MSSQRLVYQVAIGEVRPLWRRCLESVATYCKRHGLAHMVQTEPVLRIVPPASQRSASALRMGYLPIFEKWNALPLLSSFDEIAIVDADVYAMPAAGNIFEAVPEGYDCAMAIEYDMPITPAYARKLRSYAGAQYGDSARRFYNCGVELIRPALAAYLHGDSPRAFIMRPEWADYVNGAGAYRWQTEQSLTNEWLRKSCVKVYPLSWRWNALYGALTTMEGAQLVHFFLSSHLQGDDPETLLRTNGRPRV